MKKYIFLVFGLFLLTGCTTDDDYGNTYKIELNDEPYTVCGKEIYFSDDAYDNDLDIERIIETIKESCNVNGAELAKDEVEDILTDDAYTKQDILHHLRDVYNYLNR